MHTLVRKLRIAEIKWMVLASMSTGKPQNSKQMAESEDTQKRGCKACQDKGKEGSCSHFFKCSKASYIPRGRRAPCSVQGNFRGWLTGSSDPATTVRVIRRSTRQVCPVFTLFLEVDFSLSPWPWQFVIHLKLFL